ncbi:hypothetical protein L1887_27882 [Cichorium endivia]|nr:hypothetical protein L1887_27882 [Cichorium endivia]
MSGCRSSNQLPNNGKEDSSARHVSSVVSDEQTAHGAVQFTFRELVAATKNFHLERYLAESDSGCIYKGRLENTGQVVSVQHLYQNRDQGIKEFLKEVVMHSVYHHANLVKLIGYCVDGDHRLLVHEFMPFGSLEDHLHDLSPNQQPLDWNTRMKIAVGVAKGLEYLHKTSNPPVIYKDLKPSNILLDEEYHPKLSIYKLGKPIPFNNITPCVSFQHTYCPPEGPLLFESDVYSFGLVFLELITGRKPIDYTRPPQEQSLFYWARPLLKDKRKYRGVVDPLLKGRYPPKILYQALSVVEKCIQEPIAERPEIGSVVEALTYLASKTYDPNAKTDTDVVG